MLKLRLVNFKQRDVQDQILSPSYSGQIEWIIGRNANCDLVLPNPEISRVHGRIFYRDGAYHFVDLGSKSGSSVNGEPVSVSSPRQLSEGDLLQMGETLLYLKAFAPPITDSNELSPSIHLQSDSGIRSQNRSQVRLQKQPVTEELVCRCHQITDETADVKTFCFMPESAVPFNYQPGQFVNVQVEIDGKSVTRPYTLSSSPSRSPYLSITVKRVPTPIDAPEAPAGLVSNWLHDHLREGDRIKLVGGALGHFTCSPNVPAKLLFISAGSGITPMMSMSRWLQDTQTDCDVVFLHSARTPEDIIFRAELQALADQMPHLHLAITVTQVTPENTWAGLTGRISPTLLRLVAPDWAERSVYVCGPNGFMRSTKALLETMDFPMQNYQEESFGGRPTAPTVVHPTPKKAFGTRSSRIAPEIHPTHPLEVER